MNEEGDDVKDGGEVEVGVFFEYEEAERRASVKVRMSLLMERTNSGEETRI